ncbi:trans-2,3-dihydro-3-hydroxyanthranilate isomerase [Roseiarcus fermentans]|uniref:Trans-2,3-dihydro-3-hydroxyanthranilate isomerase n=1 Tax=Roseiarcus fermentans TaxID=1473586 RepID=A0A366FB70_9HYPH|nr:PhzF family phenazine biosynthesis protein [Roseiarcus fermentans]RBP11924.1 trans-2,3-dihydro-3-hydroxyanthranilate isomerase [Roseiarcus fermentans]
MARRFATLDVFTETSLAGNPLAVVLDAEGLDDRRMQAIAREFNLSETVFALAPRDPAHAARVRIFTPTRELPFAGHPTVGTACLLAHQRAPDPLAALDLTIVLEEGVGDVVCRVRRDGGALAAEFDLPRLPERLDRPPPPAARIADALGLGAEDIGFDRHLPGLFSAGTPFLFVPIRSLDAIGRARPSEALWMEDGGPAAFLYTREVVEPGSAFHARMFGGGWGVPEDPATGSAAAAFAAVVLAGDGLADGDHGLAIEQGFEMGRPSRIALRLAVEGGALRSAAIGGGAVIVSMGALEL